MLEQRDRLSCDKSDGSFFEQIIRQNESKFLS